MIFLVKALVGATAVAVPVSIGTVVAYRESIFGDSQGEISVSDLKGRCYVIPTEKSDTTNHEQAELLVCGPRSYFLYKRQSNKKINSPEQIKKQGDNLEISWEAWEDDSRSGGTSRQNINLKVNDGGWSRIQEGADLKQACSLVTDSGVAGNAEWQCKGNSSAQGQGTSEVKIQLTKFSG